MATICVCGLMLAVLFAANSEAPFSVVLAIGGPSLLGLIWALKIGSVRKRKHAEQEKKRLQERLDQLRVLASSPTFNLAITGSSGLALALVGGISGGGLVWLSLNSQKLHFPVLAAGLVLLIVFLPLLAAALRLLGNPVLILSQTGITTPLLGTLPWHEIDGLNLHENSAKGSVSSHLLQLKLPGLHEISQQFFFVSKWAAGLRRKTPSFDILLRGTSESPEVILALAQHLWTLNTGKSHSWTPFMSEEYHAAQMALNAQSKDLGDVNELIARFEADPEKELKRLDEFKRLWIVVTGEQRRVLRTLSWVVAVPVVIVVVMLIAKIALASR